MNRFAVAIAVLLFTGFVAPLNSVANAVTLAQTATSIKRSDNEWTWISKNNGRGIEVKVRGRVEFNEDYTDVTGMSSDGRLQIKDSRSGIERRLEIRRGNSGRLDRSYWVEGQSHPFDREASQWAATVIQELVRQGGLDASKRVRQIYDQRGAGGVLDEISQIRSNYVKRLYFEELLQIGTLDAVYVQRILNQVAREMSSSYEKSRVLMKVAGHHLNDTTTRSAYMSAVRTIDSNYEKGRVLSAILSKDDLSKQTISEALEAVKEISSSHEKAKLLIKVAGAYSEDDLVRSAFFEATRTIDSSYERRRVLSSLLEKKSLGKESLLEALKAASDISSDHEKASVLIQVASFGSNDEAVRDALVNAARTINSNYERGRVLSAIFK